MLVDEDVTTDQEHHARFLKKLWQLARNVLQVTCRRFHNVSWTCCKSLEKMVQRIRSIWQVTWRKVYNVPGRSCNVASIRNVLHVTWRRCYNIFQEHNSSYLKKTWQRVWNVRQVTCRRFYDASGACCKLHDEDVTRTGTCCKLLENDVSTYQERLACYLTKMLQHIRNIFQVSCFLKKMWQRARNVLQVTCWTFHSISGTCCKSLEEDVAAYQEHLASYLKSLQRIRNMWQATWM